MIRMDMHYCVDFEMNQEDIPKFESPYSSNKIRKTQNEHLIIVCQNLVGLYLRISNRFLIFFLVFKHFLYRLLFYLNRNYPLNSSSDE